MIPVNAPHIPEESIKLVNQALSEGWISSAGPYIAQFEAEFASTLGVKHAVFVNSGTAALHVALLSLGIGPGDEVIVPAFTMAASWMSILYTGATPVFVDVTPDTFNLNPDLLESVLTPQTRAIMPVHIYGHPVEMEPIMAFAKAHQLSVVEDAAEAIGATYKGKLVGSFGTINAFSFYANKIVTTGEGGMVVTNDDTLANLASRYRDLAHSPSKRFIHDRLGYNYRATCLQAALGLGSLHNLQNALTQKQHLAKLYHARLHKLRHLTLPSVRPDCSNVFWMYAVLVNPGSPLTKDQLRAELLARGIDTRDFFYPPADQPVLHNRNLALGPFQVTEDIARRGFYLPSGATLTDAEINQVCDTLTELLH